MNTLIRALIAATLLAFSGTTSWADEAELRRRIPIWEKAALLCESHGIKFPTKQTNQAEQPCDDGDMTLFNGLLCASGDERGCKGVAEAQDPETGLWHRSPRIRFLGKNDRGDADSSPDMALGIQLYLLKTKDIKRAEKWLDWIHQNTPPCKLSIFGACIINGLPKFCASENCVIRPQDYASLATVVNFLQETAGLKTLPDGALRGNLGTFSGYDEISKRIAALVNDPGFPQHLVGVGVLEFRLTGKESSDIDNAAKNLHERNPGNAFFSILAKADRSSIIKEVLNRCTSEPEKLTKPLFQWQWERSNAPDPNNGLYAWEQSSLWDCIFMAKMLSIQ